MSRRKTKPEEIRDPDHYFNRMIALEVKREQVATAEYHAHCPSLEAMIEGGDEGPSRESLMLLAINTDGSEYDRYLESISFLGWIETFKNPTLYDAVKTLPLEYQEILTYRYKEGLTVREIAAVMKIPKSTIDRHLEKSREIISDFFEKAGQKP